jgi:nucleotide sugar dehydrogenase
MEKITVIGVGKLGLCFSLLLEKAGYDVIGLDIREDYVESLNDKTFTTIEPQVEQFLKESINFEATTDFCKAVNSSNILFLTVRTTSMPDGEYDCSQVDAIVDRLLELDPFEEVKYIVVSCNVNPGFSDSVQDRLKDHNCIICYNPEWIAQGTILHDQMYPDVVVIGSDDIKARDVIRDVYKNACVGDPFFSYMDRLSAELTKISLNCYLTAKISLANMIGDLATKVGGDPDKILETIGHDKRIGSKYIKYGYGYGGPCFPRDTRAFIHYAHKNKSNAMMVEATEFVNRTHFTFQLNQFIEAHPDKNEIVEFDSVTYKPGVTLIEESQQLLYAVAIAKEGYSVIVREHPDVISQLKEIYGDLFTYEER